MCVAVKCSGCGKPTWRGCGAHVEQVLGHVPPAERCRCHEQPPKSASDKAGGDKRSILDRLLGR